MLVVAAPVFAKLECRSVQQASSDANKLSLSASKFKVSRLASPECNINLFLVLQVDGGSRFSGKSATPNCGPRADFFPFGVVFGRQT